MDLFKGEVIVLPKTQVPKEKILTAARALLIREGNEAVTIGRLAEELGCSTQPISRTFGNMENFREEFAEFVLRDLNSRNETEGKNPVQRFALVGLRYLKTAFEEPNLIYFVRANSRKFIAHGGIGTVFDKEKNQQLRQMLSAYLGVDEQVAFDFMQTAITYTQGLVSMVIDGTIDISLSEAIHRLEYIGIIYLVYAGVPREKAEELCRLT